MNYSRGFFSNLRLSYFCMNVYSASVMGASTTAILLVAYFAVLLLIAYATSRKSDSETFFRGKRTASWQAIAFGMLGVSMSGISVISVPGWVLSNQFHYLQMVLGYVLGYYAIAYILLPVYYKLKTPSIYSYLKERFGVVSYKTSALLFILNRTIIAALRLYVVAAVLHSLVFEPWGVSFPLTVALMLLLIWLYTFRAGIQTIIWTDIFQTAVMLLALILTFFFVGRSLDLNLFDAFKEVASNPLSEVFEWSDWRSPSHFLKMFLTGAFIPIVMTGLDQDMMQKNLGCRTLRDAQKNMIAYGYGFIPINLLLLSLGVLLVVYIQKQGIALPAKGDELYPMLATGGALPPIVGLLFTLGIIAATFSSADSALTALTTAFTLDLLNTSGKEKKVRHIRNFVHFALSLLILIIILGFHWLNAGSAINSLLTAVSYVYGPLLGLFSFGLFTRRTIKDCYTPLAVIAGPLLSYLFSLLLKQMVGYNMGYELLILNGAITFLILFLLRTTSNTINAPR